LEKGVSGMAKTSGRRPIHKTEFGELLMLYDLETYLFQDVHEKFERGEPVSEFDFYCIIYWKRNASKTNIKKGLDKLRTKPWQLLRQVEAAGGPKQKLKVLRKVSGIGIAIASAILAVCYPDEYTVVDSYVLKMLKERGHLSDDSMTESRYLEYNQKCKTWSRKLGISLRRMDRLLWTKAWKKRVVPSELRAGG